MRPCSECKYFYKDTFFDRNIMKSAQHIPPVDGRIGVHSLSKESDLHKPLCEKNKVESRCIFTGDVKVTGIVDTETARRNFWCSNAGFDTNFFMFPGHEKFYTGPDCFEAKDLTNNLTENAK